MKSGLHLSHCWGLCGLDGRSHLFLEPSRQGRHQGCLSTSEAGSCSIPILKPVPPLGQPAERLSEVLSHESGDSHPIQSVEENPANFSTCSQEHGRPGFYITSHNTGVSTGTIPKTPIWHYLSKLQMHISLSVPT